MSEVRDGLTAENRSMQEALGGRLAEAKVVIDRLATEKAQRMAEEQEQREQEEREAWARRRQSGPPAAALWIVFHRFSAIRLLRRALSEKFAAVRAAGGGAVDCFPQIFGHPGCCAALREVRRERSKAAL